MISAEVVAAAGEAAARAQQKAGVAIRLLEGVGDMTAAADLFQAIWGKNPDLGRPINSDLLRAMGHAGNYVAGAFDREGTMQGALVGFLGAHRGEVYLHSHILGIPAGRQVRGAGFALKLHQRAWSLGSGYEKMEWTFDPLVRRNAYFNLAKLGVEIQEYLVNFYGVMDDGQNGSGDSDRLLVRWDLLSERAGAAAEGTPVEPLAPGERPDAGRALVVGERGEPVAGRRDGEVVLVQVPPDIIRMRVDEVDLAGDWRLAVRETMTGLLGRYRCAGVTREGEYVFRLSALS